MMPMYVGYVFFQLAIVRWRFRLSGGRSLGIRFLDVGDSELSLTFDMC